MGAVTSGFANWMNRLAVGWFVLDQTDSALMTALAFTMQSAPGLIAAPREGIHFCYWLLFRKCSDRQRLDVRTVCRESPLCPAFHAAKGSRGQRGSRHCLVNDPRHS